MDSNNHIRQIYKKFLNDTATPEETAYLLNYFGQSATEELYTLIRAEMEREEDIQSLPDLEENTDRLYRNIKQRINDQQYNPTPIRRYRTWLPYAAAILIFFGIGIYWYYHSPNYPLATQVTSQYGDDVLPGTNKATITLSDGSQYELSESQQGITVDEKGIMYTDGSLVADLDNIATAIVTVPRAGTYQVTLPDGTKVILNSASSLHYPTRFAGTERRVQLEGEAYFEVTHDEKQPFVVQSKGQQVQVLGTAFNINAYENEPLVATTLVTGSVRIIHGTDDRKSALLKPGQQAVLRNDRLILRKVDAADYVAWKDGLIVLSQADLPTIIRRLERWYDVEFDPSGLPGGQSLNGELPTDTRLSGILDVLELNTGVKFKIQGRRIVIDK